MKARTIFFIVVILCLNLVLTGAAAAGTAGPPNPAERITDLGAPRSAQAGPHRPPPRHRLTPRPWPWANRAWLSGMCGRLG